MRSRMLEKGRGSRRAMQRQRDKAIARYMREIEVHAWVCRAKEAIKEACAGLGHRHVQVHVDVKYLRARATGAKESFKNNLSTLARAFDGRARLERMRNGRNKHESCLPPVKDPETCIIKGMACLHDKDKATAIDWFTVASNLDPAWVLPLYMLARAYKDKGNINLALEYCEMALRIDPGLSIVQDLANSIHASRQRFAGLLRHAKQIEKGNFPGNAAIT